MPTIDLSGRADDLGHIKAAMLYPTDPGARLLYHAIHHHTVLLQGVPDNVAWRVSAGLLRDLIARNPTAPNTVKALSLRGIVAGELLATLYMMDRFKEDHPAFSDPSLIKAIYAVRTWSGKAKHTDESNIPISRPTIESCWNEFRSVAHLWAPQAINTHYSFVTPGEEFANHDNVMKFLGVAAALYKFGSTYTPRRSAKHRPQIDARDAWMIPDNIPIIHLADSTPPTGLHDVLARYRALSIKKPERAS